MSFVDYIPANWPKERRIRAIKSMIRGFEHHFEGREMPEQSQELLNKMYEKINLIEREK